MASPPPLYVYSTLLPTLPTTFISTPPIYISDPTPIIVADQRPISPAPMPAGLPATLPKDDCSCVEEKKIIAQLRMDLQRAIDELGRSRSEFLSIHTELNHARSEFTTIQVENNSLKAENSALRAEIDSLKAENATLKSANSTLRNENQGLLHQLRQQDQLLITNNELTAKVARLNADVEALSRELENARRDLQRLREELRRSQDEASQMRGMLVPRDIPRGKFAFFGFEVADGIKFRDEYGGKQEYGAVKVVKVWGPAAHAGIQSLDFIKYVNGVPVRDLAEFRETMSQATPHQPVPVVVERNGREITFVVQPESCDSAPGSVHRTNIVHARLAVDERPSSPDPKPYFEGDWRHIDYSRANHEHPTLHVQQSPTISRGSSPSRTRSTSPSITQQQRSATRSSHSHSPRLHTIMEYRE